MTKKCTESEVITALMASPTITEAAELLGVSRRTVYNYMEDEGFDDKLKAAQEARDAELARIRETATAEALSYLVSLVTKEDYFCVSTKDRITAAKTILSYNAPSTIKG